jgi:hypothetical protein
MRDIIYISILLLLLLTCYGCNKTIVDSNKYITSDSVEKAMKYHGTLFAYNIDDKWYFDRDGKRYKLN